MENFIENPTDRYTASFSMPKHRRIEIKIDSTAMQTLYMSKFVILRSLVSLLLLLKMFTTH